MNLTGTPNTFSNEDIFYEFIRYLWITKQLPENEDRLDIEYYPLKYIPKQVVTPKSFNEYMIAAKDPHTFMYSYIKTIEKLRVKISLEEYIKKRIECSLILQMYNVVELIDNVFKSRNQIRELNSKCIKLLKTPVKSRKSMNKDSCPTIETYEPFIKTHLDDKEKLENYLNNALGDENLFFIKNKIQDPPDDIVSYMFNFKLEIEEGKVRITFDDSADKTSFKYIPLVAAIKYKTKYPKTLLSDKQILHICKHKFPKYIDVNTPEFRQMLVDGYEMILQDRTNITRFIDEIYDYEESFTKLFVYQYYIDIEILLREENVKAAKLWLEKNPTKETELPKTETLIPATRRTFPKTRPTGFAKQKTKKEPSAAKSEPTKPAEIIPEKPCEKSMHSNEPHTTCVHSEDITSFFKRNVLTVNECLNYLEQKFPDSVERKKDSYFIKIPANTEVKGSVNSSYTGTKLDKLGESFVCKYGVSIHPGHGGIEERDRPYYLREIIKGLRAAGWVE
jgi:hypothetical protein